MRERGVPTGIIASPCGRRVIQGAVSMRHSTRRQSPEKRMEGVLKVHRDGYGFVIPDKASGGDVFVPPRHLAGALHNDRVRVSYTEDPQTKKREGKIAEIVSRGRSRWSGTLEKRGRGFFVIIGSGENPLTISVAPQSLSGGRIGDLVEVAIINYARTGPASGEPHEGRVTRVLGLPCTEVAERMAILLRHDIPEDFPPEVLREAEGLPAFEGGGETPRTDLTHLPFLTIDGAKARDFDDACCLADGPDGTIDLYVAIADVAHYVKEGSILNREALSRGTSVYFPDSVVPMLPERLSNDLCSLRPDEIRPCLVAQIRFDRQRLPTKAFFYEAAIKSVKRGIYEEIQTFFDNRGDGGGITSPQLKVSLVEMKKLAEALISQRAERGSLDFDLPDTEILLSEAGEILSIEKVLRVFSHRLIEEFMIAANVAVASLFAFLKLPLLYRVHESPDPAKIIDFVNFVSRLGHTGGKGPLHDTRNLTRLLSHFEGHPLETFLHQLLLRSLKWALYSPANKGHFGLNLKRYAHFTSPIRRYPDLIVHRHLKALLALANDHRITLDFDSNRKADPWLPVRSSFRGGRPQRGPFGAGVAGLNSFKQLEGIGAQSSHRERESMEAEREVVSLKKMLFMQNHLGDRFEGVIRKIARFGLFLELAPYDIEGLLLLSEMTDDYYVFDERNMRLVGRRKKGRVFNPGDTIAVVVSDISWERRTILLKPAQDHD